MDINDTLHQIQDSKGVPAEIAELQKKFDSAMDQEDMAAAEEAVVAIEAAVGDRPIAVAARTEFELETAWRK